MHYGDHQNRSVIDQFGFQTAWKPSIGKAGREPGVRGPRALLLAVSLSIALLAGVTGGYVAGTDYGSVATNSRTVAAVEPEKIAGFYSALNRAIANGSDAELLDWLASDFRNHTTDNGLLVGRSEFLAEIEALHERGTNLTLRPANPLISDDVAMVQVAVSETDGILNGPPGWTAGAEIVTSEILRFRAGTVVERWSTSFPGEEIAPGPQSVQVTVGSAFASLEQVVIQPGGSLQRVNHNSTGLIVEEGVIELSMPSNSGGADQERVTVPGGSAVLIEAGRPYRILVPGSQIAAITRLALDRVEFDDTYVRNFGPSTTVDTLVAAEVETIARTFLPVEAPRSLLMNVRQLSVRPSEVVESHEVTAIEVLIVKEGSLEATVVEGLAEGNATMAKLTDRTTIGSKEVAMLQQGTVAAYRASSEAGARFWIFWFSAFDE